VSELGGHTREIFCADTDCNGPMGGDLIVSGGRDRTARLWDRRSGKVCARARDAPSVDKLIVRRDLWVGAGCVGPC
jgi:WD40 repeat protein